MDSLLNKFAFCSSRKGRLDLPGRSLVGTVTPAFVQKETAAEHVHLRFFQQKREDGGSTDDTANIAREFAGTRLISKPNGGKGSAVQAGLRAPRGEYILIQDADLEYDPKDYVPMLRAVNTHGPKAAVYGSRPLGGFGKGAFFHGCRASTPRRGLHRGWAILFWGWKPCFSSAALSPAT